MATKRQQGSAKDEHAVRSEEQVDEVVVDASVIDNEQSSASSAVTEDAAVENPSQEAEPQSEVEQIRQQMLRVQADFDNFRKRTRQEKEDLQLYATRKVFAELLPVMDNFDRALAALAGQGAADEIRNGMEMVQRQLLSVLENGGVKSMDVVGQPFDPNIHEGVMQVPADGREVGVVVQELQKGYWLHGKVLRPAMVAVTS